MEHMIPFHLISCSAQPCCRVGTCFGSPLHIAFVFIVYHSGEASFTGALWQALGLEIKELRCILVEDMRRYERRHVKNKAALMDQVPPLKLQTKQMHRRKTPKTVGLAFTSQLVFCFDTNKVGIAQISLAGLVRAVG